jgi:hypothetical protein
MRTLVVLVRFQVESGLRFLCLAMSQKCHKGTPVTLGRAAEALSGLGLILISTKILIEHTMPL